MCLQEQEDSPSVPSGLFATGVGGGSPYKRTFPGEECTCPPTPRAPNTPLELSTIPSGLPAQSLRCTSILFSELVKKNPFWKTEHSSLPQRCLDFPTVQTETQRIQQGQGATDEELQLGA